MNSVQELLSREDFFDAAVLSHGFTDYMRDYEVIVGARFPPLRTDVHRYQFVGCVEAHCVTSLNPRLFATSLPDSFVLAGPDYPETPDPEGFVWGVRYSTAYPGLTYVSPSERAAHWSKALGIPMHEVFLETEAFKLQLVFADVRYESLGNEARNSSLKQFPIGTE